MANNIIYPIKIQNLTRIIYFQHSRVDEIPHVEPSIKSILRVIREIIDIWLSLNSGIYNSVTDNRSLFL